MLLDAEESQLVLVDYQQRLMPAIHEGAAVLANALRLASAARLLEVPQLGHRAEPGRARAARSRLAAAAGQGPAQDVVCGARRCWLPRLRPPAREPAAAMPAACPSTCRSRAAPEAGAQQHRAGRLRGACVPAADGAGPAGRGVRGLGGHRCLQFAHRAQPRRRVRPAGRRRRGTGDHRDGRLRMAAQMRASRVSGRSWPSSSRGRRRRQPAAGPGPQWRRHSS